MKHFLSIFLLFAAIITAQAQRYNFKEYSVPEGLIHSTVTAIAEDPRGYLWVGTFSGGVSQFDGKSFVNYSEGEIFAGYKIRDIKIGPDGTIWVASNGGLANFDGFEFTSYTDTTVLLSTSIRSLLFDSNDKLWIGTSKGIDFMENDIFSEFEYNNLLPEYGVVSLIEARDKSIYIGTVNGLYKYQDGEMDSIKTFENDNISLVYCIKQDSKDNIWFGTHEGIGMYDGENVVKYEMIGNTGQNIIEDIEEDKNGNIWFATLGGGAFVFNGKEFENITDQNGLSSNGLFALYKDSNDILWIGGPGLSKYYGEGFYHMGTKEGLAHDVVFPIIEDQHGDLWFGTEGGLSHYNTKTEEIVNYTTEEGLTDNGITSIMETKSGEIWLTTQTGLNKLVNGQIVQHPKYKDVEVWTITEDNNEDVWIGTSYGLVKEKRLNETLYESFDKSRLIGLENEAPEVPDFITNSYTSVHYSKTNGFIDDALIYSTSIDDEGNVWIGTMYSGVYKYKGGKFEKFSTDNGLKSNVIGRMKSDGKGGMWITTNEGLSHYQNGEMRTYTREDGLWMDMIYNVIVDGEDIWIGGTKGIQKLTFDEDGNIESEAKFGKHEGFTSIETNDGGGLKDSKGNLWFGTIAGATRVNPELITYESSLTTTHITDIKLFFKDVDWSIYSDSVTNWYRLPTLLTLPHNQNQLTFKFTGLNLKVPEKIKYQWKLEGFDSNWSPIVAKQEANYTNIPPGNYTFLVKSSNEKGIWNPTPSSFSFRVEYPIWQRWWFIVLSIAVVVSTLWGFISYRLNHINKMAFVQQKALDIERRMVESERKALRAQINPHFIFNVLNSIQFYIQDNDPLVASRYLSKFAKLMRMILENSKSSAVPINDELEALKLYMDLEILRTEYKFEYSINIDEKIDSSEIYIPPMLIQPFIENSIRHGIGPSPDAGTISIDLQLDNDVIICIIEDNGIGINASQQTNKPKNGHVSSGMKITGDRLEILNAQRSGQMNVSITDLNDEDSKKHGTRVKIYIPIE